MRFQTGASLYITVMRKLPSGAGFSESMMNKFNQAFVMNDNSNIIVFNQPANVQKPLFAVDSNGKLVPNKSGYDLFSLVIMRNANGYYYFHPDVTYCLPAGKGWYSQFAGCL